MNADEDSASVPTHAMIKIISQVKRMSHNNDAGMFFQMYFSVGGCEMRNMNMRWADPRMAVKSPSDQMAAMIRP